MAKGKSKSIIVSVTDDYMDRVAEVAKKLRAAGMDVENVMNSAGTITGSVAAGDLVRLKQISGVAAVEVSQTYQLPPPDADVQ